MSFVYNAFSVFVYLSALLLTSANKIMYQLSKYTVADVGRPFL